MPVPSREISGVTDLRHLDDLHRAPGDGPQVLAYADRIVLNIPADQAEDLAHALAHLDDTWIPTLVAVLTAHAAISKPLPDPVYVPFRRGAAS